MKTFIYRSVLVLAALVTSLCGGAENEVAWGTYSPGKNQKTSKQPVKTETAKAEGDWGALAAFGEAGPKNFRGSATYGVYFNPVQRFKVTGEYLTQELSFHSKKKWVSQYAVGAQYQYLFDNSHFQSLDMGTAYNQAFSRKLESSNTRKQRIAGSYGALSFIGTTVGLWDCAFLAVKLDYDWIKFVRKYQSDKLSNGFGGSASFTQRFAKDFSFNLGAEFRRPFNSYQGLLNWNHRFSAFSLDLGLFGNLTYGHDKVRTIQTGGVQIGFSFGPKPKSCGRSPELSIRGKECYAREYCSVSQWVATPAVYVPVVLAIADEALNCTAPVVGNNPPTSLRAGLNPGGQPTPTEYDVSIYFSGSGPLTYSVSYDGSLVPSGSSVSINPGTGVLTLDNSGASGVNLPLTITASNSCGSASFIASVTWSTP
jgi:hypothetical protein